jgi:glutamate formiminotransferase
MAPLLEFVPNFSEGKDRQVVDALVAAMTAVPGVKCLGAELDGSHHRSVVTLAGPAPAIAEAAVRGAQAALQKLDLRTHKGEHKRMGAMDVCPFVPLAGATMADAVATAKAGRRAHRQGTRAAGVPLRRGGGRESRRVLGNFRNKEFEGLLALVGTDPEYTPDFGPGEAAPDGGRGGGRRAQVPDRLQRQPGDHRRAGRQGHRQGGAREGRRLQEGPGDGLLPRRQAAERRCR